LATLEATWDLARPERAIQMSASDALALARWILDTFGEESA
jgi:hypothetical protein